MHTTSGERSRMAIHTRRREFMFTLGAAAVAWPVAARAQQAENPVRIGFLPIGSPSNSYDRLRVEAFRQGLREVGLVENRHVVLAFVWIRNEPEIPQTPPQFIPPRAKLSPPVGPPPSVPPK